MGHMRAMECQGQFTGFGNRQQAGVRNVERLSLPGTSHSGKKLQRLLVPRRAIHDGVKVRGKARRIDRALFKRHPLVSRSGQFALTK